MDAAKRKAWEEAGVPVDLINRYEQDNQATQKTAQDAGVAFKEAETPAASAAPVETPAGEPEQVFVGDLTPEAYVALQQQANKPLLDALAGLNTAATTKAAQDQETAVALKAAQEQLAATTTRIGGLETELASVKQQAATLTATVKELSGDVPAGFKRPSQDPANVANADQVTAIKGPAADPDNDFYNSFLGVGAAGS